MYATVIKPFLDRIAAFTILIMFWWVIAIVGVLVRVKLGSPVLFVQNRPGKIDTISGKEKIFKLYKFRTMTEARDPEGNLLPDKDRLTKFGMVLRSTSLDELPELFNILKGDMSFVGPRPLLTEYLSRYSPEQRRRHSVLPGLTGYSQVRGRNRVSWDQRLKDDVWYVDHVSPAVDLMILVRTAGIVLRHSGISSDTSVTKEKFMGSGK